MKRTTLVLVGLVLGAGAGMTSALAATTGPAVVHPVLGAATVGAPVGSGLAAGTASGLVGSAVAPVAQQAPAVGEAVLPIVAEGTAAVSQGGTRAGAALAALDDTVAPLGPVVNPLVHPALDAVAAQLDAQAPAFETSGLAADIRATAALVRWARGA